MKLQKPYPKLLKNLSQKQSAPAISIIIPTHPNSAPNNIQEDQSRFNNATRSIIRELDDLDFHQEIIDNFKQRLSEIHEDIEFWRYQSQGLALYMNADETYAVGLPREPQEHVIINSMFHITPLLYALQLTKKFMVLQPSYKNPQLLKADWYDLERVNEIELPTGIEDALRIDEHQAVLQYHPAPRGKGQGSAAGMSTAFHGHGGRDDAKDAEREQYHRVIDDIVAPFANKSQRAVILAGPDEEVIAYRTKSKINEIIEPHIEGNIHTYSKQELHQRLQEVINEVVEAEQEQLAEKLHQKNVLFEPRQISEAINEGRVGSLFIGLATESRDHAKDHTAEKPVLVHADGSPDEIDVTIMRAMQYGGDIIGIKQNLIPNQSLLAATLRF